MYYEEKYVKDIEESTKRLIQKIKEGDIEGAQTERDSLMDYFRKEIEWVVIQAAEGKVRKRK